MKRLAFVFTISMLTYYISHADATISLQKLSNSNECQNINKLIVSDNLEYFENFSIPNQDYLIIKLSDSMRNACYSFKYFPNISPHLNLSISNRKLVVNELTGSTLNGNQIKTIYSINLKQNKLIMLNSKMITFDVDEKGNIVKSIHNFLEYNYPP